jgi:hypothetical protein
MNVDVYNIEEKKANYIKNKVKKYVKLLNIKKIEYIIIKFVKKIPECEKDTLGLYDLEYVTRLNKKPSDKHIIYLNKNLLNKRSILLTTLIHELVHVKQYISGKMVWVKYQLRSENIFIFWKKKNIGIFQNLNYYSSPWEIEARKIAEKMKEDKKL